MVKQEVILSGGSVPWLGIKQALEYSKDLGYDGLEILPFRRVIRGTESYLMEKGKGEYIKGIHQSWRLDMGFDREYGISLLVSAFYNIIRILLFPKIDESKKFIGVMSKKLQLPVTVHEISREWTNDNYNKEFSGGIFYEILSVKARSPQEIKIWLKKKHHKMVVDTRDDQSVVWAKNYGFKDWRLFWKWIGVPSIGGVQLTLIGVSGIRKILNRMPSLAEEQFLWLHKQKWHGSIIVEVNPLTLFLVSRGDAKQGLRTIAAFIRQTAGNGKSWSS